MINPTEHIKLNEIKWNRRSKNYDLKIFDYFRWMQRKVINQLDIKPYNKFLDIGCGTGWAVYQIANQLEDKGNFVGVDLSEGMLTKAKQKLNGFKNVSFIKSSAEKLPFENESFDFIICTNSFHHYPDPVKTLSEINRVLKTNGLIQILDVTNDNFVAGLLNRYFTLMEKEHVRFYNSKELFNMFAAAGLQSISTNQFAYLFKIHSLKKIQ